MDASTRHETPTGLDEIRRFIGESASRPLPPAVHDMARKCWVDWFAVSLGALRDAAPRAARQQMRQWATRGRAMNLYGDRGAAAPMALVNATLSHSLDYDDMHFGTAVHASGPAVAATLAVGMDRGCTEREMLHAFVTGYEVATTLGAAGVGPDLAAAGWHPTGVLGHFAAVASAAALLRLTPAQTGHAFGLAATQAAGLQASGGTGAKPFHVGKAAMNGVMAAELAALGMEANTALLDDPRRGLLGCLFQAARQARFDALGRTWQIEDNTFKPYAACQLTHAPYEAGRALNEGFRREGLREIRIHVHPLAPQVAGRTRADSAMEGKFCIAYCVALGLQGLAADTSGFTDSRVRDARLQALTTLGRVHTSEGIERWAARVELDYGDGGIVRGETKAVLGSPTRPLDWDDLDAKFIGTASDALGADAPRLLDVLHRFEQPGSLAEVARLIGQPRPD